MATVRRTCTVALLLCLTPSLAGTASAVSPTTRLVSKTSVGVAGDGDSEQSRIAANGRYIAFESYAANLPSGDGQRRVYVHDRGSSTTQLVSANSRGAAATGGEPSISGNGRLVVFTSTWTKLPMGDGVTTRVYLRDVVKEKTRLVSKNSKGSAANADASSPWISQDGRFVAFQSAATNLPHGDGVLNQIYLHELATGKTRLVSTNSKGAVANDVSGSASLSGNGRYVSFESRATNLPRGDGTYQSYVHDLVKGWTRLTSRNSRGNASNGGNAGPVISADGRSVVFWSDAANLPHGDGTTDQVFVHDLSTGRTRLISRTSSGVVGDGRSTVPHVSAGGRYVVFKSQAANLPHGDGTRVHVYLHDRKTGRTSLLSRNSRGATGNANSFEPWISADGNFASFESYASNFPGGGGSILQIYVRGPLV